MVYTSPLTFHKDVRLDLDSIKTANIEAHAKLASLLRQLRADARLSEKLLDHGFGAAGADNVSVSKWLNEWKRGKDLWRLKFWDLENLGLSYRVIYVYLPKQARFVVMAIVARGSFDYDDTNHPIRQRIAASLKSTYGID